MGRPSDDVRHPNEHYLAGWRAHGLETDTHWSNRAPRSNEAAWTCCLSCMRGVHKQREVHGTPETLVFTCGHCEHTWKPTTHVLRAVERRRRLRSSQRT